MTVIQVNILKIGFAPFTRFLTTRVLFFPDTLKLFHIKLSTFWYAFWSATVVTPTICSTMGFTSLFWLSNRLQLICALSFDIRLIVELKNLKFMSILYLILSSHNEFTNFLWSICLIRLNRRDASTSWIVDILRLIWFNVSRTVLKISCSISKN